MSHTFTYTTTKPRAMCAHVFGGGMLVGFEEHVETLADLETFDLGLETVRTNYPDVEVKHFTDSKDATQWKFDWPKDVEIFYGNPRCSGFSNFNAGMGDDRRGPCAQQTIDIRQIVTLSELHQPKVLVMESVQQFHTVGKALMDEIATRLTPLGYRFAVLKHNVGTFGVPQHRPRLFFVAYKRELKFNVPPPPVARKWTTVGDALHDLLDEQFRPSRMGEEEPRLYKDYSVGEHGIDLYNWIRHPDLKQTELMKVLQPGFGMKDIFTEELPDKYRRTRLSGVGFGFHAFSRFALDRPAKVIYAKAKYVHPTFDRLLTVRESARLMGIPDSYRYLGGALYAQVGNGVAPPVASWVAHWATQCVQERNPRDDFHYPDGVGEGPKDARDVDFKLFDYTDCVPALQRKRDYFKEKGVEMNRSSYAYDSY